MAPAQQSPTHSHAGGVAQEMEPELSSSLPVLDTLVDGAPMVCSRCQDGDMPLLPYASTQELHRTCSAACRTPVAGEGSTPAAASKAPHGAKNLDDDSPDQDRQFGEDTILSWATAVLAQSILLTKDERGIYFKWLARIVLRTGSDREADRKRHPGAVDTDINTQLNRSTRGRRVSVDAETPPKAGESEAFGKKSRSAANDADASARKRSLVASGTHTGPESDEDEPQQSPKALAKSKAMQDADAAAEDVEEAIREVSHALPDGVLNVFRIDLGLNTLNAEADAQKHAMETEHEFQKSPHKGLYSDFTDVIAMGGGSMAQRAKRAARVSKLITSLRHLNVTHSEIRHLERELKHVAENSQPHANGILLVAGAARAAQSILAKPANVEVEANESSGAMVGRRRASSELKGLDKQASQVIETSTSHARGCYERSGFDSSASKVAVALRFLENELFQGVRVRSDRGDPQPSGSQVPPSATTALGSPLVATTSLVDGEETVASVVPLLMPQMISKRLLAQAQKEWEEEEAARIAAREEAAAAEAKGGFSPTSVFRKSGFPGIEPTVRVKSIEAQSEASSRQISSRQRQISSPVCTTGSMSSGGSPLPRSQRDSNSRGSQRNAAGKATPPNAGKATDDGPLAERMDSWLGVGAASTFPAIAAALRPMTSAPPTTEVLQWRENLSDWPTEILQLFDSVQQGCHRVRSAVTHSGTWRAHRKRGLAEKQHAIMLMDPKNLVSGSRSQSDVALPRVARPVSATRKETRYKKANAASRVVSGKWGEWGQRTGQRARHISRSASDCLGWGRPAETQMGQVEAEGLDVGIPNGEPETQDLRRCESSPVLCAPEGDAQ